MTKVAMAVHGGAFAIPENLIHAHRDGCRRALATGVGVMNDGGTSLDAVEAAVVDLENDEAFDAGFGSYLNEDGEVVLDAGVMEGLKLSTGSVAGVRGVPNPVRLARCVLESEYAVLVGEGAYRFASQSGVPVCEPEELVCERERSRWLHERGGATSDPRALFGDTVGAVALDSMGNLAAATSTGGTPGKPVGRVGDSPFIGAGLYADNETAAVSTTGHGELIIPLVWAKAAADFVGAGLAAHDAAAAAIRLLKRLDARGGLLVLDSTGRVGLAWNTPTMAFAYVDSASDWVRAGP